jgi:hypothetical protein
VTDGGQQTRKIFCNQCKSLTNHLLRARYSLPEEMTYELTGVEVAEDELIGIHVHRYSMWSCAGCTEPTLEWERGYEDSDSADNFQMFDYNYFPTRAKDSLQAKIFKKLNPEMTRLYREVITCFNGDCPVLCTIGLRALMEEVCRDKKITGKDLYEKIEGLIEIVPNRNLIDALHAFRWAGNDAVHENIPLTRDEAHVAIEVMQDLLNFLYDLDYKATLMKYGSRMAKWKTDKPGPVQ